MSFFNTLKFNNMELQQIKPFGQAKYPTSMGPVQFDLQVLTVPQTTVYYTVPRKFLCGRKRKTMDMGYQSLTSLLKSNYEIVVEPKACPKYRPIRPKPTELNSVCNKTLSTDIPCATNDSIVSCTNNPLPITTVTTISSTPPKEQDTQEIQEIQDIQEPPTEEISIKTDCESPEPLISNISTSKLTSEEDIIEEDVSIKESNSMKRDFCVRETSDKVDKGSIELFFESMARTVLGLPKQVQAEIKMEICKLVTNAEIKYSSRTGTASYGTG